MEGNFFYEDAVEARVIRTPDVREDLVADTECGLSFGSHDTHCFEVAVSFWLAGFIYIVSVYRIAEFFDTRLFVV